MSSQLTLIEKYLKDPRGAYRACAGAILLNSLNQVLICRRNTQQFTAWQFPQGGVEASEVEFSQAAAREACEELGIALDQIQLVQQFPDVYYYDTPADSWLSKQGLKGQAISFSLFKATICVSDLDLSISHDEGHPPEFSEARWMNISDWETELSPYVAEFKQSMYLSLQHFVNQFIKS